MTATTYADWVRSKERIDKHEGIVPSGLPSTLFDHQRELVDWALRRGRAAIFADTGLGKTAMQLSWADQVAQQVGRVLILAPLAVAEQTVREGDRLGVACTYRRADKGDAITVANYEMLDHFDPSAFAGIVLDESSILKSYSGSTRNAIIAAFAHTPMRLACTATPAPNDYTELGNHAEFLGVMSRVEMLAEFFVHDGGSTSEWRVKGHAVDAFWRWVVSWAALLRKPSDIGYSDAGFDLPGLVETTIDVDVNHADALRVGRLFLEVASTLSDQRATRKATMTARVEAIRAYVCDVEPDEPAIVWGEFNNECDALEAAIPGSVQVRGSDDPGQKANALLAFADGAIRVLITKPSIAGFGLNWQHCARVYFVGPSHSYEQTYQAVRRCWRFGQTRPVVVRTCVADTEAAVVENYRRKMRDADAMAAKMIRYVSTASYATANAARRMWNDYEPRMRMEVPTWLT